MHVFVQVDLIIVCVRGHLLSGCFPTYVAWRGAVTMEKDQERERERGGDRELEFGRRIWLYMELQAIQKVMRYRITKCILWTHALRLDVCVYTAVYMYFICTVEQLMGQKSASFWSSGLSSCSNKEMAVLHSDRYQCIHRFDRTHKGLS